MHIRTIVENKNNGFLRKVKPIGKKGERSKLIWLGGIAEGK